MNRISLLKLSKASDRCNTDLVLGALEYGIWSRDVRDGQLIHHSDRGSTYTSIKLSERLADNGILPSMGSVGGSYVRFRERDKRGPVLDVITSGSPSTTGPARGKGWTMPAGWAISLPQR